MTRKRYLHIIWNEKKEEEKNTQQQKKLYNRNSVNVYTQNA